MIGWLCCFLVLAGARLGSELSQEDEEDNEGLPKERERERGGGAGRAVHEEEGNGCVDLTPKVPLPSMMEKSRGKTTTRTTSKD